MSALLRCVLVILVGNDVLCFTVKAVKKEYLKIGAKVAGIILLRNSGIWIADGIRL